MSVSVESSILINRPIHEVFTYATDWDKYPLWEGEVLESRKLSDGPTGVGTTYRHVAKFMGRRLETEGVVTAYEPNHMLCFKVTKSSFPFSACQEFREGNGGTRAIYTFESELNGILKLLQPLTMRMAKKTLDDNYTRLKKLLEAGDQQTMAAGWAGN